MAAVTESENCDSESHWIWVKEKRKKLWIIKDKGPIFILNHRVPLVPLILMLKNAFKNLTMYYSEKKKKYNAISTRKMLSLKISFK